MLRALACSGLLMKFSKFIEARLCCADPREPRFRSLVVEALAFFGFFVPLPPLAAALGDDVPTLIIVLLRSLGAGRSAPHACLQRDYSQVLARIMGLLRSGLDDHFRWIRP